MKTIYLNWVGPHGRETIDEFTPGIDAPIGREFRQYVRAMIKEYWHSGICCYRSSRACKGWKA